MFLIRAVESKDDHAFNTTHSPQIRKRRLQPVAASNRRKFVPVTFQLHAERERVLPSTSGSPVRCVDTGRWSRTACLWDTLLPGATREG